MCIDQPKCSQEDQLQHTLYVTGAKPFVNEGTWQSAQEARVAGSMRCGRAPWKYWQSICLQFSELASAERHNKETPGSHLFLVACTPCSSRRLRCPRLRRSHTAPHMTHSCTHRRYAQGCMASRRNHKQRTCHHLHTSFESENWPANICWLTFMDMLPDPSRK